MDYKYVSIDRIFSKVIRDIGSDMVAQEADIIEWVGEALEFIGAITHYEEAVAFLEVKNHQCNIPAGTHSVIQIARNHCWTPEKENNPFCPKSIVTALSSNINPYYQEAGTGSCCSDLKTSDKIPDYTILDCNGQPLNDYEVAYYRPYFDLQYEYNLWVGTSLYQSCYHPVRLSTGVFFDSLIRKQLGDETSKHNNQGDEYNIIRGEIIRFNFKEGSVAIALARQVVDKETGYPLVPDNISYTTAITKYITMKIFEREYYRGREGAKGRVDKAQSDWHWYCKQASNVDMMPYGVDEHQNLLDQRSYLLPNHNRYYGFFGKLAKPEGRKYNDPDRRNHTTYMLRGN